MALIRLMCQFPKKPWSQQPFGNSLTESVKGSASSTNQIFWFFMAIFNPKLHYRPGYVYQSGQQPSHEHNPRVITAPEKRPVMYRLLYISLVVVFILSFFSHSNNILASSSGASISIAETEASPGDIVDVPVTVSGFQGVHVIQLRIAYNSDVLTGISFENMHSSIASAIINPNSIPMTLSWFNNMNGLDLPDGTKLFDLRFEFCQDEASCIPHHYHGEVFFLEDESYIAGPPPNYIEIPLDYHNGAVFDPHADTSTLTIHIAGEGQVLINGDLYTQPYVTNTGTTPEPGGTAWSKLGI